MSFRSSYMLVWSFLFNTTAILVLPELSLSTADNKTQTPTRYSSRWPMLPPTDNQNWWCARDARTNQSQTMSNRLLVSRDKKCWHSRGAALKGSKYGRIHHWWMCQGHQSCPIKSASLISFKSSARTAMIRWWERRVWIRLFPVPWIYSQE